MTFVILSGLGYADIQTTMKDYTHTPSRFSRKEAVNVDIKTILTLRELWLTTRTTVSVLPAFN